MDLNHFCLCFFFFLVLISEAFEDGNFIILIGCQLSESSTLVKNKGNHLELQKCKSTGKTPAGLNLSPLQFCLPPVSGLAGVLFIETGLSRCSCCFLLVNSEIFLLRPSDTHRHQWNTNMHLENSRKLAELSFYLSIYGGIMLKTYSYIIPKIIFEGQYKKNCFIFWNYLRIWDLIFFTKLSWEHVKVRYKQIAIKIL